MARKKKIESVETQAKVVATLDEPTETKVEGETTMIACHLPFDIRFDDIPDGKGGKKSITLQGLNCALRGKASGILTIEGSLAQVLLKRDWEAILRIHGREAVFTGVNGGIPCIVEVGNKANFKARESELREQRHGLEPIEPKKAGVVETPKEDLQ